MYLNFIILTSENNTLHRACVCTHLSKKAINCRHADLADYFVLKVTKIFFQKFIIMPHCIFMIHDSDFI